jgi:hypothetical protein
MTRDEWKSFHRQLRLDVRDFRNLHGGFPRMTRHVQSGGREWSMTRSVLDNGRPYTYLRPSIIRERTLGQRIHEELGDTHIYRRKMRVAPWAMYIHKAQLLATIKSARKIRTSA